MAQQIMLASKLCEFSGNPDQYCFAKKPYILCFFRVVGGRPDPMPPPSGPAHAEACLLPLGNTAVIDPLVRKISDFLVYDYSSLFGKWCKASFTCIDQAWLVSA